MYKPSFEKVLNLDLAMLAQGTVAFIAFLVLFCPIMLIIRWFTGF